MRSLGVHSFPKILDLRTKFSKSLLTTLNEINFYPLLQLIQVFFKVWKENSDFLTFSYHIKKLVQTFTGENFLIED